jgi:hypothetical protein
MWRDWSAIQPGHPYTALTSNKIAINAATRNPGDHCGDMAVSVGALSRDTPAPPAPYAYSDMSIDNGRRFNVKLFEAMGFAV